MSVMQDETPRCRYEAVRADLTDAEQRAAVLARADAASNALVLSEGLLIYLTEEDVTGLARALHERAGLRWWLTDLASPALLKMMRKQWGHAVEGGGAPFRFAPAASGGSSSRTGGARSSGTPPGRTRGACAGRCAARGCGASWAASRRRSASVGGTASRGARCSSGSDPGGYSAATTRLRPAAFAR